MDRSKTIQSSLLGLTTGLIAGLGVGFGGGACGSPSLAAPQVANDQAPTVLAPSHGEADTVTALRAKGPDGLREILARYDAAPEGAAKEALAVIVDRVAAQRYATVSRLFWHTDLEEAKAAARARKVPILSLRMLGRLDEDLSCANSRLFRVVLYANADVSAFLRDNFVLHWSSERLVPRVTIDYGDGRVIETTVGGNSAHYVLDWQGRPVDVVPGLYGPKAFKRALEGAIAPAIATAKMSERDRLNALAPYHGRAQNEAQAAHAGSRRALASRIPAPGTTTIGAAEQLTMSKAMIEQPIVRVVKLGAPLMKAASEENLTWELGSKAREPARLDAQSRALVAALKPTDWRAKPSPLGGVELDRLVQALEFQVTADTVLSELGIRFQIHQWFQAAASRGGVLSFESLNERIYSELFLTPAADPWLGISTPGVFTGLPADGTKRHGS